jgi:hypothetical protein
MEIQASVCVPPPPFWILGRWTPSPAGEGGGGGEPIQTTGQKLWHSVNSVVSIKNVKRKLAGNTVDPYGPIDNTLDPHQLPLDSTFKICFTRPYNPINHIKVQ